MLAKLVRRTENTMRRYIKVKGYPKRENMNLKRSMLWNWTSFIVVTKEKKTEISKVHIIFKFVR